MNYHMRQVFGEFKVRIKYDTQPRPAIDFTGVVHEFAHEELMRHGPWISDYNNFAAIKSYLPYNLTLNPASKKTASTIGCSSGYHSTAVQRL